MCVTCVLHVWKGLDLPHVGVVHVHVYPLLSRVLERVAHLHSHTHTHKHTHTQTRVNGHVFCAQQRCAHLAPHPQLGKAFATHLNKHKYPFSRPLMLQTNAADPQGVGR